MIIHADVEEYLHRIAPESEGVLAEMEAHGRERDFPLIGPLVGRLLHLLAATAGARRVFECGSGYGYSAWWFATAVGAEGEVFLTDDSAENVERAREYLGRAGLADLELRGRKHARHRRQDDRHGPVGDAAEERGPYRHADDRRAETRP